MVFKNFKIIHFKFKISIALSLKVQDYRRQEVDLTFTGFFWKKHYFLTKSLVGFRRIYVNKELIDVLMGIIDEEEYNKKLNKTKEEEK